MDLHKRFNITALWPACVSVSLARETKCESNCALPKNKPKKRRKTNQAFSGEHVCNAEITNFIRFLLYAIYKFYFVFHFVLNFAHFLLLQIMMMMLLP